MRRRDFIAGLGSAAAWPLATRAQQQVLPVVGLVSLGSADAFADNMRAFHKGLGEASYVEGRNVLIEYHWLEGRHDGVTALMDDLVRRRVAAITIPGTTAITVAAKAATSTVPVVFFVGEDPVKLGLVESQARPGGNATGFNYIVGDAVAQRLAFLHELLPKAVRIGVLTNPANAVATEALLSRLEESARSLGLRIGVLRASSPAEIDIAFDTAGREGHDALFVAPDTFFSSRRAQFAAVARRERIPACYGDRETVAAGGLMSCGIKYSDTYRQVGLYTGRILKGENPADLPVVQTSRFEFVINRRTATLLGIEVPTKLIAIADEVIEQ
jgi:putative tryptophan/tyrosine transport system substrate-binding protein